MKVVSIHFLISTKLLKKLKAAHQAISGKN
jgi:hypothetical protein